MFASFSNRMTAYFATLLIASLGGMFLLWYFGAPALGIVGAGTQRYNSAMQTLEVKADLQRNMLATELKERMGDVQMIADSSEITQTLQPFAGKQVKPTASQFDYLNHVLAQKYLAIQRAHQHRFTQLSLVHVATGRVFASTRSLLQNQIFSDVEWLQRLPITDEEHAKGAWKKPEDQAVLMLAYRVSSSLGGMKKNVTKGSHLASSQAPDLGQFALVALLDLRLFFEDGFEPEPNIIKRIGVSYLFDSHGHLMSHFPAIPDNEPDFSHDLLQLDHVESTRRIRRGDEFFILVSRNVFLGEGEVWSLVHVSRQIDVMTGLLEKINMLLAAGVMVTILALSLIYLAARRLTRPLAELARSAMKIGEGDLTARVGLSGDEAKEVLVLASAFNGMAQAVEQGQVFLEHQIAERTRELARSEAKHSSMFNATPSAVVVLDRGWVIDGNPAAIAIFGAHDLDDLLGRHISELTPDAQNEARTRQLNTYLHEALQKGHLGFEWQHRRLDTHQVFDAELLINRLELNQKELVQVSVRDISERKRVEAALHASEARHRTLVEWSPEGINVHRKGRLVYVNAAAIRMLGATRAEQLIGIPILQIIHPNYHHLMRVQVKRIDDPGVHDERFEIQYVRVDGEVIDVNAQAALIDFDGLASIYVAWHDVTESKRHAESQRIAATVFESQEGMFVLDTNWHILRTNQSLNQITALSTEEQLGRPAHFLTDKFKRDIAYVAMLNSLKERGSWQGEVSGQRRNGEEFPAWLNISSVKNELGVTTHFVGTFNDITLRKKAEDEIRHLAFYDPLTQLPNRRLLMDRLEQALATVTRHRRKGALLFIDLDNFKTLNDTLGHDQGDLLLQQVAERLTRCTREGDTVARLGGDEFVVMLEGLSEDMLEAGGQAETVAIKILSELNQTYWLGVNEHHSSPSIGVTLFGEKQEMIAEPLKRADLAMYQAKEAGRNTIRFFDPKMQALVSERAALEEDLRDAMLNGQFELYYQAQFNDLGHLFGAEVLVRWMHPKRGVIAPSEFIPLAEETGLISILGYWVLHTATHQLAAWASHPILSKISIAVNVSPNQFHQKNFVEQVLDILAVSGADPNRLKVELTEGFSISDIEDVIAKMTQLKQVGVGFSLDDFGTGYSSLSYLKRLPLDQLKIDQSFVRDILVDPNDAAISRMVIVLAESLGLMAIAEGVETQEQKAFLQKQGCRAFQGYLYSRPLRLAEFERFALQSFETLQSKKKRPPLSDRFLDAV